MTIVQPELGEPAIDLPTAPHKEMISVSVDPPTGKTLVRINSSSLGVIQECPRKSQYLLKEKWRSGVEAPATIFGSAMHKALEVFYSAPPEERRMVPLERLELVANGHPVTENQLLERSVAAFAEKATPLAQLPDTDKRSLSNGAWILHNYFKAYVDDPYVALVDKDGPFIERQFTHRFSEDESLIVDIFGTIDFAFRHIINGNILVGDHKTASSLGWGDSSYYDRDRPNHQYTMYMLGAKRVFGFDTEEFMVNVIEVKAKPKTTKGSAPNFPRQITKRTEEDFDELHDVVMKAVHDYLYFSATNIWPLGPIGACTAYGGCTYKQVCAAPKSLRETILKNKFTRGDA